MAMPMWAMSQKYSVSVTRKFQNFYQVDGRQFFIATRYCYVYAYSEDAILDVAQQQIHFLNSRDACDVNSYYTAARLSPGRYSVTVSRKEDNLYEVSGGGMLIRTSLCLELALADDAVLSWEGIGGTLHFLSARENCDVAQLLTRTRSP